MPSAPTARRSEPTRIIVLIVLVLALVVSTGAGALLHRPGESVTSVAVGRATDEVWPGEGVDADRAQGLHLYLVPHPDDELSAWTSLTDDAALYPVLVLFTQGSASIRCRAENFSRALQSDGGEVAPQPRPDRAEGEGRCGEARVGSFRAVLDEAQHSSPGIAGLGAAELSDLPGLPGARYAALDTAALVVLDLPDAELTEAEVRQAVDGVLARVGHELPDLPLTRVTASAYFAEPGETSRCDRPVLCPGGEEPFPYTNADHHAVREAARDLRARTTDGVWLVTTAYDPGASVFRALPHEVYDEFMALGPEAERVGIYQRLYGWLAFPGAAWRPGDLPLEDNKVMFSRVQAFEVVAP